MAKYEKLEDAVAAMEKLEADSEALRKQIATLNSENAGRRKRESELESALEQQKRAGESEAEKRARETVGKEYEGKLKAQEELAAKSLSELQGQLRRLTLEGAAVKAGLKPDVVGDAIRLLPDGIDDAKVGDAFRDLGKRYPVMLAQAAGGPDNSPGSRGGSSSAATPRSKAEILFRTEKVGGKDVRKPNPTAERDRAAFVAEHGRAAWESLPN